MSNNQTLPPELIARMAKVLRKIAEWPAGMPIVDEVRALVADPDFPKPVDPDLVAAREWLKREGYDADDVDDGEYDDVDLAISFLAGAKHARGE